MKDIIHTFYRLGRRQKQRSYLNISIFIVLGSLLTFVSFQVFEEQLQRNLQSNFNQASVSSTQITAQLIEEKVNSDLNLLLGLTTTLANLDSLDVDYWLEQFSDDPVFSSYHRIAFVLPNGHIYSKDLYDLDIGYREYVKRALAGEVYISELIYEVGTGEPMFVYIAPIVKEGQVVGALGFGVKTQTYSALIELHDDEHQSSSYIIDRLGNILVRDQKQDVLSGLDRLTNLTLASSRFDLFSAMEQQSSGIFSTTLNNTEERVVYSPIGISDWYLLSFIPQVYFIEERALIEGTALNFTSFLSFLLLTGFIGFQLYERRRTKEIIRLAYIDSFTKAANLNGLRLLYQELIQNKREVYAMVLVDIDRFKLVNDLFGYHEGDQLIRHLAKNLYEQVEDEEYFARIQAEQFAVLVKCDDLEQFKERTYRFINSNINYRLPSDRLYRLVFSLGIYVIKDTDTSFDLVFDRALIALNTAKSKYDTNYVFYDDTLRNSLVEENQLEKELEIAIKDRQFTVFYQPRFDLDQNHPVAAEALIRWIHPDKGLIAPNRFIPLLEKSGFIVDVDIFVFEEVCRSLQAWRVEGYEDFVVSVNQSKLNVNSVAYVERLIAITNRFQIPRYLIEIELTESILTEDIDLLKSIIQHLRHAGFLVSIDDFGTGYSSLNLLKDIDVDVLKLDQGFLRETARNKKGRLIIKSIINMARQLKIITVAEGIESSDQIDFLTSAHCQQGQGYYFSKPLSKPEFERDCLPQYTRKTL